jgi:hypothetical protein
MNHRKLISGTLISRMRELVHSSLWKVDIVKNNPIKAEVIVSNRNISVM